MKKILIVANDSGGAEILAAFVYYNPKNQYIFCLDGPAKFIFARYGHLNYNSDLNKVFAQKIDQIITGTSWSTDLEKKAIVKAKNNNIPVITFIDNWCFYKERFFINGQLIFPDQIWVCDEHARNIALNELGDVNISIVKNPYLIKQKEDYSIISTTFNYDYVLYLSENVGEHSSSKSNAPYFGYNDYDALAYYLSKKNECEQKLSISNVENIIIRPHPSEEKNLYKKYIDQINEYNIIVSNEHSLLEQIKGSIYVVGLSSMAMAISCEVRKPTFSCIPPEGIRPHFLPYDNIVDIIDL